MQQQQTKVVSLPSGALPPQNIDAEEAIIGGLLLDKEAINEVIDRLPAEAFYIKAHQEIYRAILSLHSKGSPADLTSVVTHLSDKGRLEPLGGMNRLAQLLSSTVSAVNIDHYAELVVTKYLHRQLITTGKQITELGLNVAGDIGLALEEAQKKVFALGQSKFNGGLTSIEDSLVTVFNSIEELHEGARTPGVETGFYDLDAITGGFQPSDLIIIAGRPSMGKTSLALNIASNVAKSKDLPVAIFSLEMSKEQLTLRLLAAKSKVDSNRLRSGKVSQQDLEKISQGIEEVGSLPIYIEDNVQITAMQIGASIRRLQSRLKKPTGLILIDYLQLMGGGGENRVQELARITRSLKAIARESNAPVVALSQLSRGVEQRTNKRPMMSDLRESGSIEQDADLVLMLYRDEYYNPDTPERGIAELSISKHRNGPTGVIKLMFNPALTEFLNMENRNNQGSFTSL